MLALHYQIRIKFTPDLLEKITKYLFTTFLLQMQYLQLAIACHSIIFLNLDRGNKNHMQIKRSCKNFTDNVLEKHIFFQKI